MSNSQEKGRKKVEDFPLLSSGELHLWQVSTDITPTEFEEFKSVLVEKELTKVPFFKFKQAQDSYITSQGALRILLAGYLGITPKLVKLGQRRKGKPYSIDDERLYFNMSHSGNLTVLAFSYDSEVGIDIEQIRPLPDLDEMINKNFTTSEIKFIIAKPEEKISRFFRFWTVKESYLKAIGEGMRLTPDNLEFIIENNSVRQLSVKGIFDQQDWNFREFSVPNDYVGTITYGRENTIINHIAFNTLIS